MMQVDPIETPQNESPHEPASRRPPLPPVFLISLARPLKAAEIETRLKLCKSVLLGKKNPFRKKKSTLFKKDACSRNYILDYLIYFWAKKEKKSASTLFTV